MRGTVTCFNSEKGYEFIISSDGIDVFVHWTGIIADGFKCLESG